jgi:replicative DNA helicase
MATKEETSTGITVGELLALETSVLRTLCLTVNTAGSELKYKILDTLSSDNFYFPINKAIFEALEEMHRKGDYIIHNNLDEELKRLSVHFPEDFFLEDLFDGDLPRASELEQTLGKIKERALQGTPPRHDDSVEKESSEPAASKDGKNGKSGSSSRAELDSSRALARATGEKSDPDLTQVRAGSRKPRASKEAEEPDRMARGDAAKVRAAVAKSSPLVLASEGTELSGYLEELGSKQGKSLESGFPSLDEATDGLGPGVMVIVDEDRDRLSGFLKQIADQLAEGARVPCLYISYHHPKALLRIRTLARLSGVSARDIEKGRLKKDSPEWRKVEQCGTQASGWMKRLFVVEAGTETNLGLVRKMCRQLMDSSNGATCVLVVDGLERLNKNDQSLSKTTAELKELGESMDILVVGGTEGNKPVSNSSVDFAAVLKDDKGGGVAVEVQAAGESKPQRLVFEYLPSIFRFIDVSS